MGLFDRDDQDFVQRRPIHLFTTDNGTKAGQTWSVRLRVAAEVDTWLRDADETMEMARDVEFCNQAMIEMETRYRIARAQFELPDGKPPPTTELKELREALGEQVQPEPGPEAANEESTEAANEESTEADVEEAKGKYVESRERARTKTREWQNAKFECVIRYDPVALDREVILKTGITDAMTTVAFDKLRYFSDPLLLQQAIGEKQLAAVRRRQ